MVGIWMAEQIALSTLLVSSSKLVRDVMGGQSTSDLLPKVDITIRAGVHAISFHALRHYGKALSIANKLLTKSPPNSLFLNLLCVSLSLLIVDDSELFDEQPVYKEFVVLDESVNACSKMPKTASFKGLLNACLRNFLRNKTELIRGLNIYENLSYPQWWYEKLKNSYPNTYLEVLNADKKYAPINLRINTRKISRADYLKLLSTQNIEFEEIGESGIKLSKSVNIATLPGYDEGLFSVQDIGAQNAAFQLPIKNGDYVLDACSAPGGKAAHLLERFDIDLLCMDADKERLERVKENLNRLDLLGQNVHLLEGDASLKDWWDGRKFDAILADVPCTGSGVVRRHPDIKWLRKEADVIKTVELQRKIIINLWDMLKFGGYLLYVTCSVFKEEGELQAQYFTTKLEGIERLPSLGHIFPPKQDGFFYALFKKN
ncbi:16S rRNA (cytosine(967)-C(5))-methyltransferase RsmB [Taylorella equigenitalis]|uniref:16S rRNA (cytosine(967)-C(5))-methyltransferase RsmB n=1 Tax=Taylorella equigenitalis TaxID=29575 RepID=UPI001F3F7318|nr:16S rRNA (cytosine(967)-C(5))-methyltransferase RsmB [Taylorella equigenitalis]